MSEDFGMICGHLINEVHDEKRRFPHMLFSNH